MIKISKQYTDSSGSRWYIEKDGEIIGERTGENLYTVWTEDAVLHVEAFVDGETKELLTFPESDLKQAHSALLVMYNKYERPAAKYRWIVTKDHIDDGANNKLFGPRNADPCLKSEPSRFSLYDDDGECYFEGMLYGDYSGFEPLDDLGAAWGCTEIRLNRESL